MIMEKAILRILCISLLLPSTSVFSQSGHNINGQVRYHDNFPMSGVTAYLHDSNGDIIDSTNTNNGGHYTFHDVARGNYTINFMTGQPAGGVTLTDAYLVMLRLLNIYTFNSIQELAADVDGSGFITWEDYYLIVNGYLNEGEPFPVGPWVFEQLAVTIPHAERDGFTSRGGSSGDVNGSLIPDPKICSIFLDNPVMNLTAGSSDPIEFRLTSATNQDITGMHLVLRIPEGLSVVGIESPISAARISILKDQVRVTWMDLDRQVFEINDGMPLLVIKTKLKRVSRDGDNFSLRLSDESHFINADGELISGVSLILPTINLVAKKDIALSVYPNPFKECANLSYQLQEERHVLISLFDQGGRLVKEIVNGDFPAGNHLVKIDGTELMPGIYYYSIYTGSDHLINSGTIIKSK